MTFFQFVFSKIFLKQLLLAVVILLVLVVLMLWWLRISTNHNEKIPIPDLSMMTLDRVEAKLAEMDLRYEVLDSANYNPNYPKYSVIEQIPMPGKFVKEDRKLYLVLNPSGYRKIEVPNVVGRTRRQAEPTLLAMGFQIGKISYRPHISDNVLEMRFEGEKLTPGTLLQKTSTIDLIVGDESLNQIQTETETDEAVPGTSIENEAEGHDEF